MGTQFEFRLIGANSPAGELDADHLLAIVSSLKEIATKIGRAGTDAEPVGRAPKRVQRVAKLSIALVPGSTGLMARRSGVTDSLEFDLREEQAFDQSFQMLIESIARNHRPTWVSNTLALAALDLTTALQQAAPQIEFKVAGNVQSAFRTSNLHRETWKVVPAEGREEITFVGRLYSANLNTHRFQVQDDVGHQVALPKVVNDADIGRLLGSYVSVTGTPERDAHGRLTRIRHAVINAASHPPGGSQTLEVMSLDDILANSPGIEPAGIPGLTDAEADAFFEAVGL